tara:strand:+ start:1033 stop:1239 length:207 start_codon:yes stop_codon:yes gene_type:complete
LAHIWQSGQTCSGQWLGNRRHGPGKQVYSNGDVVTGFWENDELNGKVIIKFSSCKKYYGEISNGVYVD